VEGRWAIGGRVNAGIGVLVGGTCVGGGRGVLVAVGRGAFVGLGVLVGGNMKHPAILMVLVSIVTAPFRAKARPANSIAPVAKLILVSATIFPTNLVVVPSVAELPPHAAGRTAIDDIHRIAGLGCKLARYLENKERIGVALEVERESGRRHRKQSRRRKTIDARRER